MLQIFWPRETKFRIWSNKDLLKDSLTSILFLMMYQLLIWFSEVSLQKLLKINKLLNNRQREQNILLKGLNRKQSKFWSKLRERLKLLSTLVGHWKNLQHILISKELKPHETSQKCWVEATIKFILMPKLFFLILLMD